MKIRRNLTISLVFSFLALAALAGCAPAPQGQSLQVATETPTIDPVVPLEVVMYARDFNISVGEALRRLSVQNAIGGLGAALEREQTDTFAGLWLQHEPEFRIVVVFTQNGEQTIRPYIEGKSYADLIEVRQAEYSLAELEAGREVVTQAVRTLGIGSSSGTDVMRNRVTFWTGNPDLFKQELHKLGVDVPPMVEILAYDPDHLADTLRGGVETYTGPDGQTIYFPKQAPTNVFLEAGMGTRLMLDENGCLRTEDGNLVLWRYGFTLRVDGKRVEVLDDQGRLVARVGEEMTGGGGEVPFTSIPGLPLEACPTENYWQLGDINPLP